MAWTAPPCGWSLVWCHERCFKLESKGMRQGLASALREDGGRLVCLKKSDKFAWWLDSTQCSNPFVLLTDWREAKPCMQTVTKVALEKYPFLTIVLCGSLVQARRAFAWANQLPPNCGPVRVCLQFEEVMDILKILGRTSCNQVAPPGAVAADCYASGQQDVTAYARAAPDQPWQPAVPARPWHPHCPAEDSPASEASSAWPAPPQSQHDLVVPQKFYPAGGQDMPGLAFCQHSGPLGGAPAKVMWQLAPEDPRMPRLHAQMYGPTSGSPA